MVRLKQFAASVKRRILSVLRGPRTETNSITNSRRPPGKLRDLYILTVDFKVDATKAAEIDAGLEKLRVKYGIDFLVLEPGIKVGRFEDV